MRPTLPVALLMLVFFAPGLVAGDEFTYVNEQGKKRTIHARLAGAGQGILALELDDGRWEPVLETAVESRKPTDGPEPVSTEEMARRLEKRFSKPLFVSRMADPYVVGLVLMAPLDEDAQPRAERFLDKATSFLQSIDRVFTRFAEKMGIPLEPPRFPLVMLIFETDANFDAYTQMATRGGGLSTQSILGFYSPTTNWLAIRLDECDSFAVPLHEAIHQQVFNRGVLQRLAPLPVWFNEGIATGFENDGAKISVDPTRINRLYGGKARQPFTLRFADIIQQDDAFHGDVLAGEAYTLAWCLHWLLVTTKPDEYTKYIRKLGSIEPLADTSGQKRLADFETIFGLGSGTLEQTIGKELTTASRKQRVRLVPQSVPVGKLITQDQLGHLEVGLVRRAERRGVVQGVGKLKNLSPFRTLSFRVTVAQGDRGIVWLAEDVPPGRRVKLDRKFIPASGNRGYSVSIRSAISGSVEDKTLKSLPH